VRNGAEIQKKEREYLFDNMRVILIVLVVAGHLVINLCQHNPIYEYIYCLIYMVHMPAFVFVTGYFSKQPEKNRANAVEKSLVPYVVFSVLLEVTDRVLNIGVGDPMAWTIFRPTWGMWYFLAMFWWKLMLKDLIRVRFILPASLGFGIICGFSHEIGRYLALSRTFGYLFFFLLGYYCRKEYIEKLRKLPKCAGILCFLPWILFVKRFVYSFEWYKSLLLFKRWYPDEEVIHGVIIRLMVYVCATLFTLGLIIVCSKKRHWFTYVGTNSITVYLGHLFLIKIIERFYDFEMMPMKYTLPLVICVTIGAPLILANHLLPRAYKAGMNSFNQLVFHKATESRLE